MAKTRILALIIALFMVSAIHASVRAEKILARPPGTTRYAAMVQELQALADYDRTRGYHRLTLSSIGQSVEGRELWMVTLHDPAAADPGKRVFYLCRQHGHEPASTEGALKFITDLAHANPSGDLGQCLKRVTVYIVPMANPDGAEHFLRHNANNVDLNRDWLIRSQPETRALWNAMQKIHPDLMTDQHELYPNDNRPDFTETAGPKTGAPADVTDACESLQEVVHLCLAGSGLPNRSYAIEDKHSPRLAHRFGCIVAGIPTILFETNRSSPSRTIAMRAEAHEEFMRIVLRDAAGEQNTLLAEACAELGIRVRPNMSITQPGSGEENEGQ